MRQGCVLFVIAREALSVNSVVIGVNTVIHNDLNALALNSGPRNSVK